jgi:hypothetical protein
MESGFADVGLILQFNLPWLLWVIVASCVAAFGSTHEGVIQYIAYWWSLSPMLYPWLCALLGVLLFHSLCLDLIHPSLNGSILPLFLGRDVEVR